MRFAPEYVTYVLNENFEDAKAHFLSPLMALHYAHLVMLAQQRIISAEEEAAADTPPPADADKVKKLRADGEAVLRVGEPRLAV